MGDGITHPVVRNIRTSAYHQTSRVFIGVSGDNAEITDCSIMNLSYAAPEDIHVIMAVDSNDFLIARNVIGNIGYSQPTDKNIFVEGIYTYLCTGTIRNNLIFNLNATGLGNNSIALGIDSDGVTDLTVEHNTVTQLHTISSAIGIQVGNSGFAPGNVLIRDDISGNFDASGGKQLLRFSFGGLFLDGGPTVPVDNSCAWGVFTAFAPGCQLVQGAGLVLNDPNFKDPDNEDFHLGDGSPCIGSGHDGSDMGAYGGDDPLKWAP